MNITILITLIGSLFLTTTIPTQPQNTDNKLPESVKKIVAVSTVSRGGDIPSPPQSPYSKEEIDLLARVMWSEAQGEPLEGKCGVINVVLNRVKDDRFPNTIREVIYQKNQFESVSNGAINIKPDSVAYKIVEKILVDEINTVGDSVFFYNPSRVRNAKRVIGYKELTVKIGRHQFAR